jgi:hypothetical protein
MARAEAPDLPVGRAWTYKAEVPWTQDKEITIVVAQKNATGYLFAGATEEDILDPISWGELYFGPQSLNLSENEGNQPILRFPLYDGATWNLGHLNVTAHLANVSTPAGTEAGFVIEGAEGKRHVRAEYAPSVGYLTSYLFVAGDGATTWRLSLQKMGTASSWVWATRGPIMEIGNDAWPADPPSPLPIGSPAGARPFEVPAGYDALVVSVGGTHGRAAIQGPGGASWMPTFDGPMSWSNQAFPAPEGRWSFALTNATQDGWVFAHAVAVKWLRG